MENFSAMGKERLCPSPDLKPHPPRRFEMPDGAVDCHAHVIGPPPYSASRGYTPSEHGVDEYLDVLDKARLAFGVLVQPTVHGTDNSVLLGALQAQPRKLRGIAVIEPTTNDAQLQALSEAGVVGLRLVDAAPGGVGLTNLDRYDAICSEMGWHLQVMTHADRLTLSFDRLGRLKVPLVIDHMGYFPAELGTESTAMTHMKTLLSGGAWVKLSGAFRVSRGRPYDDTLLIAQALFDVAPNRCVWGSDWPHVNHWEPMPNLGDLLDLLHMALPHEQDWHRVLVDNPQRLYGLR